MPQLLPAILKEMRPKQWTKNALLFAGIIFSQHLGEPERLLAALSGFIVFCGLSSVIYIFNDLHDLESDRKHPLKRNRPIASGALPVPAAWVIGAVLAAGSLLWSFSLNLGFGFISLAYFVLMLLYSTTIKHMVILDLMVVAIGFVIRAIAGVLVIEKPGEPPLPITPWFITCVMFLALFIVICKRRHEIVLLSDDARHHRPVLEHYSEAFLDQMVSLATTATVMSYALYAILGVPSRAHLMVYTVPFVLYGVCRYLYLVYKKEEGGAPENLLMQDWSLLINVVLWLIVIVLIFY